jgi:hypothetical protein
MNKRILLAVALTFGLIPSAFAQAPQSNSQEEQAACMDDAFRFCGEAIPDRSRVFNCLAANRHTISPRCQAAMAPYLPAEPTQTASNKKPKRSKDAKKGPINIAPR